MPELSRFFSFVVYMQFKDDGRHHKPHIHVKCGSFEASVGIDGELLAGKLPVKELNVLRAWISIHEDELYANWSNAVRELPVEKIAPLR